jgi:hypothetical protein
MRVVWFASHFFGHTRAMLLVAMVSLQRGKQLGETRTESIMRFPDDRGLLFNYVFGKTLRNGTKHVFGVLRSEDAVMCPVTAMDEYVHGAAKLGVRLGGHGRYLFPPCRDGRVCMCWAAEVRLNDDLRYWLTRCKIFDAGRQYTGCALVALSRSPLAGSLYR